MDNDIPEIKELIQQFSKLPGLGPKSAKRIILKLINNKDNMVKPLAKSLAQVYKNVTRCNSCGSLKSNVDGCTNCEKVIEKFNKICVVEDLSDQWSIENSDIFNGFFHILGGTISSVGNRREDLLISKESLQRIWILRKYLNDMKPLEAMEFIKDRISKTQNNEEFLISMNG